MGLDKIEVEKHLVEHEILRNTFNFWERNGSVLSPRTSGDAITTSGTDSSFGGLTDTSIADTYIVYSDTNRLTGNEKYTYTNNDENYYATFDGVKDYITCAYADQTGLDFGTGDDFSIAFWHLSVTQKDVLWHKGNSAANAGYSFEYSGDKMRFRVANGATSYYTTSTTDTIDTAWHFTVITKNDSGINIYTDGGDKQTNAQDLSAFDTSAGNPFYIGQGAYGANEWEGSIDDVTWWNMALSDADVSTLFGLGINGGSVQTANIVTKLDFQKGDLTDSYGSNDFSYGVNAYITTDDIRSQINTVGNYKSFGRAEFEGDAYFNLQPDGKVGFGIDPDDIALRDYFVFQKTGIDASDTSYRPNVASIYGDFTTGGGNGVFTGLKIETKDKSSESMGQQFAVHAIANLDYNNKIFSTIAGGKFASSLMSGKTSTCYSQMTGITGTTGVDNAGKLTLRPATEMAGGSFGITFSGTGDADQMASTSVITELTTASRISAATLDILGGLTITDPTITTGTVGERRAVDIMPQTVATTNWGLYVRGNNNLLTADTYKNYMGTALDVALSFDGEDLIINSENITANDEIHFTNFDAYTFDNTVKAGDGGTTNYTEIKADGEINLHGTARTWKSVDLPVQAVKIPAANYPANDDIDNFGFHRYDDTTEESVFYTWVVPLDFATTADSGKGHFALVVESPPTSGGTNVATNVRMGFEYKKVTDGDVFSYTSGTSSGYIDEVIAVDETAWIVHRTSDDTMNTTGWVAHDKILFRFYRDATAGEDTYVGDAWIKKYHLGYLVDKLGEAS